MFVFRLERGTCPFFAATSGHFGYMPSPWPGRWACPFPSPRRRRPHRVRGAEDPGEIPKNAITSAGSCKFCVSTHKM